MKHLLLTTIAVTSLLAATGFAGPIHNAAFSGNIETVKQHIAAGTDVNAMNKYGSTPLYEAVTGGHKDIADLLISKGADVNAKEAKNRITALHWAAWRGRKEIAELLIAKGANLNTKNNDGRTPLHNAAWKGHVEIAKLLIGKNADVNAKDVEGQTPLDWAEEEKQKETAALLRKHGGKTGEELEAAEPVAEVAQPEPPTAKASDWSIHEAARTGNIEAVKQHLAAGTDVNAKGYGGSTPLQYAANKEIAELLIAEGADVTAKGKIGGTPLHNAANKEIAELLISKGADVNAKDEYGDTPLDWAIQFREPETADLLRKHGGKTGEELKAEGK